MMATLSDTQVDLLLREAEERLQVNAPGKSSSLTTTRPATDLIKKADDPPKKEDKLSVRVPQKPTRSDKVWQKISSSGFHSISRVLDSQHCDDSEPPSGIVTRDDIRLG